MKISKSELIEMDACELGLNRFIEQTNNTEESVEVETLVGGANTYDDLLWLASKTIPTNRIARFACDCALINIEKIMPLTDKYDSIVNFLNDPKAECARDVALNADSSSWAAGWDDGARRAARSASSAGWCCCGRSVDDAVQAAGWAAEMSKEKVNELLCEMFNEF